MWKYRPTSINKKKLNKNLSSTAIRKIRTNKTQGQHKEGNNKGLSGNKSIKDKIEKINNLKVFLKISYVDKTFYPDSERKDKTQINTIINEREITNSIMEI